MPVAPEKFDAADMFCSSDVSREIAMGTLLSPLSLREGVGVRGGREKSSV